MMMFVFALATTLLICAAWSHARMLHKVTTLSHVSTSAMTRLWTRHCVVNGALWLLTLAAVMWMVLASVSTTWPTWVTGVGAVLAVIGSVASLAQFVMFGSEQAMGIHFFFPTKTQQQRTGVYHYLKNPMYDAFVLAVVGFGLFRGSVTLLAFSVIMVIVLHGYLAPRENNWLQK